MVISYNLAASCRHTLWSWTIRIIHRLWLGDKSRNAEAYCPSKRPSYPIQLYCVPPKPLLTQSTYASGWYLVEKTRYNTGFHKYIPKSGLEGPLSPLTFPHCTLWIFLITLFNGKNSITVETFFKRKTSIMIETLGIIDLSFNPLQGSIPFNGSKLHNSILVGDELQLIWDTGTNIIWTDMRQPIDMKKPI